VELQVIDLHSEHLMTSMFIQEDTTIRMIYLTKVTSQVTQEVEEMASMITMIEPKTTTAMSKKRDWLVNSATTTHLACISIAKEMRCEVCVVAEAAIEKSMECIVMVIVALIKTMITTMTTAAKIGKVIWDLPIDTTILTVV